MLWGMWQARHHEVVCQTSPDSVEAAFSKDRETMPQSLELMEQTLSRVFADSAVEGLFGSGPERAISAYRSFWAEGTHPTTIIECPLLDSPSYDVLVGSYGNSLVPGTRLPEENPPACHAAYDWAAALDGKRDVDVFFELDADGPEGQHAGIHCRHKGDMGAALDFYQVIGEGWRAPLYRAVVERLPEGWQADFAAVFAGRVGAPTRLELSTSDEVRRRIGESPEYLRAGFDQMGFSAYDGRMLEEISQLCAISLLDTLQFDILEDGSLGGTFSITSCYERTGADFARLFEDDGIVGRICRTYERMGCADDRWRLAEKAIFATKRVAQIGLEARNVVTVSMPNCGKAKWIDAKLQPAKIYLQQGAFVGKRWGFGIHG